MVLPSCDKQAKHAQSANACVVLAATTEAANLDLTTLQYFVTPTMFAVDKRCRHIMVASSGQ